MEVQNSGDIDMFGYDAEEIEETLVFYEPPAEVNKVKSEENNKIIIKQEKSEVMEVEDQQIKSLYDEDSDDSDDEETIATFLTSNGQRLALYAVEDSDEVFAVAAYDETGAPPTDFQFLMKSDVEKLIGEGAVKTVKRPKPKLEALEVLNNQNEEQVSNNTHNEIKTENIPVNTSVIKTTIEATPEKKLCAPIEKKVNKTPEKLIQNLIKTENSAINVCYSQNQNEYIGIDPEDEAGECEEVIIEQSTVQSMLCGEDQFEPELTFEDVQATFKNFKNNRKSPILEPKIEKKLIEEPTTNKKSLTQNTTKVLQKHIIIASSPKPGNKIIKNNPKYNQYQLKVTPRVLQSTVKTHTTPTCRTYVNKKMIKNNVQTKSIVPNVVIKKEIEDYTDYLTDDNTFNETSVKDDSNIQMSDGSSPIKKVKRSRKQKLTTVNRGDSEIIIQPVSAYSDEEESEPVTPKRRGRRKKNKTKDPDYSPRSSTKKLKKSKNSFEIIDLDNDESEKATSKNVLEITIDDNKEKGSSDKENDIISVIESDEENEKNNDSPLELECDHCYKIFRKRKALANHLKICPKLPENLKKEDKRKDKEPSNKEYPCKICGEVFNLPVILARHVRCDHKKIKPHKDSFSKDDRSLTPELESKSDNTSMHSDNDDKVEKEEKKSSPNTPISPDSKRRGRPKKIKNIEEKSDVTPSKKIKSEKLAETSGDEKDNLENNEEISDQQKKGKPFKKRLSISEQSLKNDDTDLEERKKARPIKKRISMDESYVNTSKENESRNLNKEKNKDETADHNKNNKENQECLQENTVDITTILEEKNKSSENEDSVDKDLNNKTLKPNDENTNSTEELMDVEGEKEPEVVKEEEKESKGEDVEKDDKNPNHTWKIKKLNCPTCNEWFSSAKALSAHNISHHKNDQSDSQSCPVCNELIESSNYIEHSKTHTGDSESEKSKAPEDITEKSEAQEDITEKSEAPEVITEKSEAPEDITEKSEAPEDITEKSEAPEDITEKSIAQEDITEKSTAQEDITEKSEAQEDITEKPELIRRRSTRIRTAV